ncbi:hypothetical protein SUDANB54_04199 [Streptomyces sp. enrichment culture]
MVAAQDGRTQMNDTVPPITEDDPSVSMCSGDHVGRCSQCHRRTHRYGRGGNPLCSWCFEARSAKWGSAVRHIGREALL